MAQISTVCAHLVMTFLVKLIQSSDVIIYRKSLDGLTVGGCNPHALWNYTGNGRKSEAKDLQRDLFVPGNILHIYAHSINTLNPQTGQSYVVAGDTANKGYTEGRGSEARFKYPSGLYQINRTHVLILDRNNFCIRLLSREDNSTSTVVGGTYGYLDGPFLEARLTYIGDITELPFTNSSELAFTDPDWKSIRKLDMLTEQVSTIARVAQRPLSITVDPCKEILYFTFHGGLGKINLQSHEVEYLTPSDGEKGLIDGPLSSARFSSSPRSITFLTNQIVLLADYDNEVLRVVDLSNNSVSTIGQRGYPPAAGSLTSCQLYRMFSVLPLPEENKILVGVAFSIGAINMAGRADSWRLTCDRTPEITTSPSTTTTPYVSRTTQPARTPVPTATRITTTVSRMTATSISPETDGPVQTKTESRLSGNPFISSPTGQMTEEVVTTRATITDHEGPGQSVSPTTHTGTQNQNDTSRNRRTTQTRISVTESQTKMNPTAPTTGMSHPIVNNTTQPAPSVTRVVIISVSVAGCFFVLMTVLLLGLLCRSRYKSQQGTKDPRLPENEVEDYEEIPAEMRMIALNTNQPLEVQPIGRIDTTIRSPQSSQPRSNHHTASGAYVLTAEYVRAEELITGAANSAQGGTSQQPLNHNHYDDIIRLNSTVEDTGFIYDEPYQHHHHHHHNRSEEITRNTIPSAGDASADNTCPNKELDAENTCLYEGPSADNTCPYDGPDANNTCPNKELDSDNTSPNDGPGADNTCPNDQLDTNSTCTYEGPDVAVGRNHDDGYIEFEDTDEYTQHKLDTHRYSSIS